MHMQARDHGGVGIAGPAATAFGKQHHGQLRCSAMPSMRSVLA
jgi:hypothetical protein